MVYCLIFDCQVSMVSLRRVEAFKLFKLKLFSILFLFHYLICLFPPRYNVAFFLVEPDVFCEIQ